jgi:hypothetical protein
MSSSLRVVTKGILAIGMDISLVIRRASHEAIYNDDGSYYETAIMYRSVLQHFFSVLFLDICRALLSSGPEGKGRFNFP